MTTAALRFLSACCGDSETIDVWNGGRAPKLALLGEGYAIEWPDLDEHIGIEGLLAGRRSGESKKSFEQWLAGRMRNDEKVDQHQIVI